MPLPKRTRKQITAQAVRKRAGYKKPRAPELLLAAVGRMSEIEQQIYKGVSKTVIAKYLGVSVRLFKHWIQVGERERIVVEVCQSVKDGEMLESDAVAVLEDVGLTKQMAEQYVSGKLRLRHEAYRTLAATVSQAEASFIIKQLERIGDERTQGWQRFAWLLERLHPQEYALISRAMAQTGEDDDASAAAVRRASGLLEDLISLRAAKGEDATAGDVKPPPPIK